jgi:putative transposase
MEKYQNKYRIPSARWQDWDYAWDGAYFITICTQNREHYFGEIIENKMVLSNAGTIADILWYEIKNHAKNIELDEFVVMPNHIHGILILRGNGADNGTLETRHALSLQNDDELSPGQKRFQNQGKNTISSIMGSYKSAVTKHCHRLGLEFGWQPRFHDHIIRNDESYINIQNYIRKNPSNWDKDKFYGN